MKKLIMFLVLIIVSLAVSQIVIIDDLAPKNNAFTVIADINRVGNNTTDLSADADNDRLLDMAFGGTDTNLSDPADDRILFWDDSAGIMAWLDPNNLLSITGLYLDVSEDLHQYTWTNVTAADLGVGSITEAYDNDLNDIAALTPYDSNILVGNGTDWVVEGGNVMRASLGLAIGTDVQAYNEYLTGIDQNLATTYHPSFAYANITNEANGYQVDGIRVLTLKGTSPSENIFLGQAGNFTMTGLSNIFTGYDSGKFNTTGSFNFGLGFQTLKNNTIGEYNTALGIKSLENNIDGSYNFGLGYYALGINTSGSWNIAIGDYSLFCNVEGNDNVAIGGSSLLNSIGNENTAIGVFAGNFLTTGEKNVFIGFNAGKNQTTNSNHLIIDNQDRGSEANEIINSLIYGVFDADPNNQKVRFNADVNATSFTIGANTLTTSEFAYLDGIDQNLATTATVAHAEVDIGQVGSDSATKLAIGNTAASTNVFPAMVEIYTTPASPLSDSLYSLLHGEASHAVSATSPQYSTAGMFYQTSSGDIKNMATANMISFYNALYGKTATAFTNTKTSPIGFKHAYSIGLNFLAYNAADWTPAGGSVNNTIYTRGVSVQSYLGYVTYTISGAKSAGVSAGVYSGSTLAGTYDGAAVGLNYGGYFSTTDSLSANSTSDVNSFGLLVFPCGSSVKSGLKTVTLNAGGSGYAFGETPTITQGGASNGTVCVDTVDGGGAILTFHINTYGTAYSVADGLATTGGNGSGFKVNITAVGDSIVTSYGLGVETAGVKSYFKGNLQVNGSFNFAADAGASDTYVITLSPAPAAYTNGMMIIFDPNTANTGACTLNVNALGAKSLKAYHDKDPNDNYIEAHYQIMCTYSLSEDVFQIQTPSAN